MVFYIEPVAHIVALAVYRKLFTFKDIFDNERYQLLWKVIRTVVVRASRDAHGHAVGVAISHDNHVGAGL